MILSKFWDKQVKGLDCLKKCIITSIIKWGFYLLLLVVIIFVLYQFSLDIFNEFFSIKKKEELDVELPFFLQFSENLFLYTLPIFIIIGFIKYLELDVFRFISDEGPEPNPEAEYFLHLSKKLFVSSIFSYLVIKIIEQLFYVEEKVNVVFHKAFPNVLELASYGVFLILLIFFILKSNPDSRPDKLKDESIYRNRMKSKDELLNYSKDKYNNDEKKIKK